MQLPSCIESSDDKYGIERNRRKRSHSRRHKASTNTSESTKSRKARLDDFGSESDQQQARDGGKNVLKAQIHCTLNRDPIVVPKPTSKDSWMYLNQSMNVTVRLQTRKYPLAECLFTNLEDVANRIA